MKLMVVESPNKVKKIESILGDGWKVVASVGHVRDLPKHDIGLEAPDFCPRRFNIDHLCRLNFDQGLELSF